MFTELHGNSGNTRVNEASCADVDAIGPAEHGKGCCYNPGHRLGVHGVCSVRAIGPAEHGQRRCYIPGHRLGLHAVCSIRYIIYFIILVCRIHIDIHMVSDCYARSELATSAVGVEGPVLYPSIPC